MTYINPRQKPLAHLDRLLGWQRGEQPAPVTIEWDLSNRCPYGCSGCHFAYTHTKGPFTRLGRLLPMAQDRGGDLADPGLVRRVLGEVADAGVKSIVWTGGGEPTTHPEWLGLMQHAQVLGLAQGLYTMGALITASQAIALRQIAAWVVISLDHPDAETYAREKRTTPALFDRACAATLTLTGGSATIGASFLLHADNWTQAPRMLALARSLGVTYTTFRPRVDTDPTQPLVLHGDRHWVHYAIEDTLAALAQEPDVELDLSRFRAWAAWSGHGYTHCQGPTLNTTITPDGRVWICPNRREYRGSSLGDLALEPFSAVWARHPGRTPVTADCRAMCRLHPVNQTLDALTTPRPHEAFI